MTTRKAQDQHIADLLDEEKPCLSRYLLLLALLVLAILCVVLSWGQPPAARLGVTRPASGQESGLSEGPTLAVAKDGSILVTIRPGTGDKDDLFLCDADTSSCVNLTRSPSIRETWPALDNEGSRIAFYGIGEASTDLFVVDVSSQILLPLTVRADTSGLHKEYQIAPILAPAFSPDGQWVAFPARRDRNGSLELFVARSDGQQVLRVTDLGHEIRDYTWLDNRTILIAVRWADQTLHYWTARLEAEGVHLEPFQ